VKTYTAILVEGINAEDPLNDLSAKLDSCQRDPVDHAPWPAFPYKPKVSFALAYDSKNIYLKYYVEEHTTRAVYTEINDPVFKDSCVEFFVAFNKEPAYYNLEFNFAGVCLGAYRTNRDKKTKIPTELLQQIKTLSVLQHKTGIATDNKWQLTILIPLTCFCFSNLHDLQKQDARANFYKCGDDLPQPHYLCWSPIDTPKPDFHRPDFFGKVEFR
jgi:hypothetical protein